MAIILPRNLGPVQRLVAGEWTAETASGLPAICCPGCGGISDLPKSYAIGDGGEVSPAWSCPFETCPLFEWIRLEAYGEDVLP